jgi:hypothetical protein
VAENKRAGQEKLPKNLVRLHRRDAIRQFLQTCLALVPHLDQKIQKPPSSARHDFKRVAARFIYKYFCARKCRNFVVDEPSHSYRKLSYALQKAGGRIGRSHWLDGRTTIAAAVCL